MRIFSIFAWRKPLRDLGRIAAALEEHNRILRAHWNIRDRNSPRKPIEFGSFDVEAANKEWREQQESAGVEVDDAI